MPIIGTLIFLALVFTNYWKGLFLIFEQFQNTWDGVLLSLKRKSNSDLWDNMIRNWKHHAEWYGPDVEGQLIPDSTKGSTDNRKNHREKMDLLLVVRADGAEKMGLKGKTLGPCSFSCFICLSIHPSIRLSIRPSILLSHYPSGRLCHHLVHFLDLVLHPAALKSFYGDCLKLLGCLVCFQFRIFAKCQSIYHPT